MKTLSPVALALCAGMASPALAVNVLMTIDPNNLTINGSSTTFRGIPFTARYNATEHVAEFWLKGDLIMGANERLIVDPMDARDRAIRIVVGNDASFPGGIDLNAKVTGGGSGGFSGSGALMSWGGAGAPTIAGGSATYFAAGGLPIACLISNGGDGKGGIHSALRAENGIAGSKGANGLSGGSGNFGVNNFPSLLSKVGVPGAGGLGGSGGSGGAQPPVQLNGGCGAGGAGGYTSGSNGSPGTIGPDGKTGGTGSSGGNGNQGGAAFWFSSFTPDPYKLSLVGGNGGGGSGGGGGGGGGGSGSGGQYGGCGGGGGATSCVAGGDGGAGGKGGNGGEGGQGGFGGDGGTGGYGGGAIELSALGKITFGGTSTATARGFDGNYPVFSGNGANGQKGYSPYDLPTAYWEQSGKSGSSGSGNGANGARGGSGGNGGSGGPGGEGARGGAGTGGTIVLAATELNLGTMTFNVRGGVTPEEASAGRVVTSYSHVGAAANLAYGYATVQSPNGAAYIAQASNPYVAGAPVMPYIAGLQGGAAIGGIVPGLQAKTLVNAPSLGTRAVGVLLLTDQDVPGVKYDKTKWNALLYLNISNGVMKEPGMVVGLPPAPAGSSAVEAGPTYNPATGSYYFRLHGSTWPEAEASAVALGGHLVTIETAAEDQWVFANMFGQAGALWIGLHRDENGDFGWSSYSPATYRHWAAGEPNNWEGYEPAAEMWWTGEWNDTRDDAYFSDNRGIVEVEAAPPAAPVRLKQFGWANDPRFGGIAPVDMATIPANQVYMTLVPVGTNPSLASMQGGRTVGGNTQNLTARTFNFGLGTNNMLVLRTPCFGDFNADDMVDDTDFQTFIIGYNKLDCEDPTMTSGCPADLNRDGFVDDFDFQIFVVAYNNLLCP